ncbi:MAG: dTMP kinase [Thermoplasmata archaeon]|nr:dTMP kinase [Thermoplasmata archaeon]
MKSSFITLEGIDGCGKSSLIRPIASRLTDAGIAVETTAEPTKTWLGDAVRRSYGEEVNPYTEAFLFLADRATHSDWIRNRMEEGKTVISDRYSDSTVAYQAALLQQRLGGKSADYINYLQEIAKPVIITPDITLLLDVDPEISLKRLGGRSELEKFENLDNLRLVRKNYLEIANKSKHIRVIDASKDIAEVKEQIFAALGRHFDMEL